MAIHARGLRVERGGVSVLHGIDLDVVRGRITGLLGPSGSGKTTLMRAIVGVQANVSGTLEVLGEPAGAAVLRSRIGYVTQAPSVYADLPVETNLRYFARIVGAPPSDVSRVIDEVGLGDVRRRPVRSLSGGQQARVSLAVALLGTPELLVLDEPTVGLDPVLRRELWNLFAALAAAGRTLLVSSHVMDEAERCDELVLVREGDVIAHDTPAALLARTGTTRIDDAFLWLVEGVGPNGAGHEDGRDV